MASALRITQGQVIGVCTVDLIWKMQLPLWTCGAEVYRGQGLQAI